MNLNKIACDCASVTYCDIMRAVENGARSFEDVQRLTGCGKSCIKCHEFIDFFIESLIEAQNEQQ